MALSRKIHHSHSFTRLEIYCHIYFIVPVSDQLKVNLKSAITKKRCVRSSIAQETNVGVFIERILNCSSRTYAALFFIYCVFEVTSLYKPD